MQIYRNERHWSKWSTVDTLCHILISNRGGDREEEKTDYLALDVEGDEDLKEGCICIFFILLVITGSNTFHPDTHTYTRPITWKRTETAKLTETTTTTYTQFTLLVNVKKTKYCFISTNNKFLLKLPSKSWHDFTALLCFFFFLLHYHTTDKRAPGQHEREILLLYSAH